MDKLLEAILILKNNKDLSDTELARLIASETVNEQLASIADEVRQQYYGKDIYVRGLIEFTNYCRNNCYYCGIRAGNNNALRYRLHIDEIIECTKEGYELGLRTFVLQGGEDLTYSDKDICQIVNRIKEVHPDCAVTLSIGEKSRDSYKAYFDAGADRYLLRHETACDSHYTMLHPESLSLANRKKCLWNLKEIGYQVGSGFMVGSPFQTTENLLEDLRFLKEIEPDMIGIGPFLSHKDTPFRDKPNGSMTQTIRLISILRLLFPYALIPATTALGTIHPMGREMGIKAGANVVMPNLSPMRVRKLYSLYDNKISTGEESAQSVFLLKERMAKIGYRVVTDRGDVKRKS